MPRPALLSLAAIAACLCAATVSAATTYLCDIDRSNNLSPVPPQLLIVFDEATGAARVMDGFITNFSDHPIPAQVTGNSASELSLRWSYRSPDIAGNRTRLDYRARLRKSDGAVSVSFRGHQIQSGGGRGTCQVSRP